MRQLHGREAAYLQLETLAAPMHLGALTLYDPGSVPSGRQRFRAMLATIEARLHLAPSLRRRLCFVPLALDDPWWVEDADFDLEFHVRHIALPRPGDWRQLCIQAARLHARPLDLSRPPWEFTVIEGLDGIEGMPPGAYAVLSKVHLAAVPALLRSEIFEALHDQVPVGSPVVPPERPWRGESAPTAPGLLARAWLRAPVTAVRRTAALSAGAPCLRLPGAARGGPAAPTTRFEGTLSAHRVFDARVFDLAAIGRIRRAVPGASVHDVVLAICGGALRRQLCAAGELPETSLLALAPRPPSNESGPQPEGRAGAGRRDRGSLQARLEPLIVALATHLPDPLQRLHCIQAEQRAGLNLKADDMAGALLVPPPRRRRPHCNCVVMYVPGPPLPRYSAGARMLLQYGLGPLQEGVGLLFSAFSYCGYLTLSFTACREQLPAPDRFAAAMQTAFDELLEAATGEQPTAAAGTAAAAPAGDGQHRDGAPAAGPGAAASHVRALSASLGHDQLLASRARHDGDTRGTYGSDSP